MKRISNLLFGRLACFGITFVVFLSICNLCQDVQADHTFNSVKTIGGDSTDRGISVAIDSSGNVYITGFFRYTVDFDPGESVDNHTSAGEGYDIFLSKYDSTGAYQWTKTVDGDGYHDDQDHLDPGSGHSVAIDSLENVYITGSFSGSAVDFDPGEGIDNHTSQGIYDIFLSKYDSTGAYQWTKTVGGEDSDRGRSIAIDSSRNIYLTGSFRYTVDFDSGLGTSIHTSQGTQDIFLLKLIPCAPNEPRGLTATPGDRVVNLDWDNNSEPDIAGYNIYSSTTSGSDFTKINISTVTNSQYQDSGLTNGVAYYYKVTALDTDSYESDYSSEVSATPNDTTIPSAPIVI